VNQVVQIHVNRKVLVHSDGDRFDERKMLENDPIAPGGSGLAGVSGLGFHRSSFLFSGATLFGATLV
jgi:hypothetical protein